jgi:predicted regulator of Ras-like GTPase activity (Roadblock/LC7/MglB family)
MNVIPSIWLSSITSALFFFSGGTLWGKAASLQRAIEPTLRDDRAARRRAEEETAAVREQAAAQIRQLTEAAAEWRREAIELRREVERLSGEAAEAEALRREARERPALGDPPGDPPTRPAPLAARPTSDHRLETMLTEHLDALSARAGTWRAAALSDMRGFLVASAGDVRHDDDLAAAAALASEAAVRLSKILPLGEPAEIRVVDVDGTAFTARWLRGDHDGLLVSTLGGAAAPADPHADAIYASISNLIRGS